MKKVIDYASRERPFEFVCAPVEKAAPEMVKSTEFSNMFQVCLRFACKEGANAERTLPSKYTAFFYVELQRV
jgi:hypothetical protein